MKAKYHLQDAAVSRRKSPGESDFATPFTRFRLAVEETLFLSKNKKNTRFSVTRGTDGMYYAQPKDDSDGLTILFTCETNDEGKVVQINSRQS